MNDIPAYLEALAARIRSGAVLPFCLEDTRMYIAHAPDQGEAWGRAELTDTRQIMLRFREMKSDD